MRSASSDSSQAHQGTIRGMDFKLTESIKPALQRLLTEYKRRESQRTLTLFRPEKSSKLQRIVSATTDEDFTREVEALMHDHTISRKGHVDNWFESFGRETTIATLGDIARVGMETFGSWLIPAPIQQLVRRSQEKIRELVTRLAVACLGESIALHVTQILDFCIQVKKELLTPSQAIEQINNLLRDNNFTLLVSPISAAATKSVLTEEQMIDDCVNINKEQIENEIEEEEKKKKADFQHEFITFANQVITTLESFENGLEYRTPRVPQIELSSPPKITQIQDRESEKETKLNENMEKLSHQIQRQDNKIKQMNIFIEDLKSGQYSLLAPYLLHKRAALVDYESAEQKWSIGTGLFSSVTIAGASSYIIIYGFSFLTLPIVFLGIGLLSSLGCIWGIISNELEAKKLRYSIYLEDLVENYITSLQQPLGFGLPSAPPVNNEDNVIVIELYLLLHHLSTIRSSRSIECEQAIHEVLLNHPIGSDIDTVSALARTITLHLRPILSNEVSKQSSFGIGFFAPKKDEKVIAALRHFKPIARQRG